jgi:hypothetical protein
MIDPEDGWEGWEGDDEGDFVPHAARTTTNIVDTKPAGIAIRRMDEP